MRRGFFAAAPGLLCLLTATVSLARDPLTVNGGTPQTFDDAKSGWEPIPAYLQGAQCGGWSANPNESVAGKIATVAGLPGHASQWNGVIPSGMGKRIETGADGGFQYPDNAKGLTTACEPYRKEITKKVWDEATHTHLKEQTFAYPYFEDPPCRTEDDKKSPLTPELCLNFCNKLNTWTYRDCVATHSVFLPQPEGPPLYLYDTCDRYADLYLCSDFEVPKDANGAPATPACVLGEKAQEGQWPNAMGCQGAECRCWGPGCIISPIAQWTLQFGMPAPFEGNLPSAWYHPYISYFRKYIGSFTRDKVEKSGGQDDTTRESVPVACYGLYDEFDPKVRQTHYWDRRCVMNIDVSNMSQTQAGKGQYGERTVIKDTDPQAQENQRTKDETDKDLWYLKLGWGFSLLNERSFKNDFGNDLSKVYLDTNNLDRAKMKIQKPVDRIEAEPKPVHPVGLRSFDDTGPDRVLVRWFQKQQTEVSVLLHPPVVRLLLPAGWAFGVDPEDPIFSHVTLSPAVSPDAKRSQRIELQINADDDMLGEALGFIERSELLHTEEQPIPFVIPTADPTNLRAAAQAWCTWWIKTSGGKTCQNNAGTTVPPEVKSMMDGLLEYADYIEQTRILRTGVASYAGRILQIQQQLTAPISTWMQENLKRYKDAIKDQKELAEIVDGEWRAVQGTMNHFHEVTNRPWCMSQRFTSMIFSLLDEWLPSRAENGKMSGDGLPNLIVARPEDLLIDFSSVSSLRNPIQIPVLRPEKLKIDIGAFLPTQSTTLKNIPKPPPPLPPLQPILDALNTAADSLPKVATNPRPIRPIALPILDVAQFNSAIMKIRAMRDILNYMNFRYDRFWQSIGPLTAKESLAGAEQKQMKEKLACNDWDDLLCQHVEMDLLERLQRIGSRPEVILKEDWQSVGTVRLVPDVCLPDDDVCLLLHGEKLPRKSTWQINGPDTFQDGTAQLRSTVRSLTLPKAVGDIDAKEYPPYAIDGNELLPMYDVPAPIRLNPAASSSASSAAR